MWCGADEDKVERKAAQQRHAREVRGQFPCHIHGAFVSILAVCSRRSERDTHLLRPKGDGSGHILVVKVCNEQRHGPGRHPCHGVLRCRRNSRANPIPVSIAISISVPFGLIGRVVCVCAYIYIYIYLVWLVGWLVWVYRLVWLVGWCVCVSFLCFRWLVGLCVYESICIYIHIGQMCA